MKILKLLISMVSCVIAGNIQTAYSDSSPEFFSSESSVERSLPFSEAVRVGETLYLSGQIGLDSKTGILAPGGIEGETRQVLENIKRVVEAHGSSMEKVVKCTVMLADIAEWGTFNKIYVTYFSPPYPARSAFAASGLALNSRVEVECIAVVPKQ